MKKNDEKRREREKQTSFIICPNRRSYINLNIISIQMEMS